MESPSGSNSEEKHVRYGDAGNHPHTSRDEYHRNQQIFYSWDMPHPDISSKAWPICLREICRYGDEAAGVSMLEDWKETLDRLYSGDREPLEGTSSHKESIQYLKRIIDEKDSLDHSPLALAARMGCAKICQMLLDHGADVHYVCRWTTLSTKHSPARLTTNPLLEASDSGSVDTVECLVNAGADVNYRCEPDYFTPIHVAINSNRDGLAEIVRFLLENGADPDLPSGNKLTPLIWAISSPRSSTMRDECQNCAVHLIRNGAKVDGVADLVGCSPLHCSAALGYTYVVEELIKAGADLEASGEDGTSPLLVSIANGRTDVALTLIKAGADVRKRRENGSSTALHWGAGKGNLTVVKALLEAGAGVNALDNHCVTPLLAAASRGHVDVVRHLLHHGGNDKLFNLDGHTPLHLAEGKGHSQTAQLLRIWRGHYLPYRKDIVLCREKFLRENPEKAQSIDALQHVEPSAPQRTDEHTFSETQSIPSGTMKQSQSGMSSIADSIRGDSSNRFRGSLESQNAMKEGGADKDSLGATMGSTNEQRRKE